MRRSKADDAVTQAQNEPERRAARPSDAQKAAAKAQADANAKALKAP